MSGDEQWQPPVESPGAPGPTPFGAPEHAFPPPGQAPYGPPQGQPYGTPQGQPYGTPGPQQGWTPPPKPGLIPLRPIEFGTLLGASFAVLRRNPKPTYGAALIIYGIIAIASIVVVGLVTWASLSRVATATQQDLDEIVLGSFAAILVSSVVPVLISIVGSAILQGVLVVEVARGTLGEKLTLKQLLAAIKGRFGALIGWAFLLTLAGALGVALVVGLTIGIGLLGPVGVAFAVLFGIVGGLGLVVLYAWLSTKLALVPSAIVLERLRIRDAMARSWSLTKSYFWKTFGILILVALIVGMAVNIVSTPLSFASSIVLSLIDPTGSDSQTAIVVGIALFVVSYLVTIAIGALGAVVQSATPALIYLDLRIRKEGLDLELIRFVEERQAGRDSPDPFAPRPAATASDSPWL